MSADDIVCAHTDFRFRSVNDKLECPYCHGKLNVITRRIWKGGINGYFHALAELVCSSPKCPFPKMKSWDPE